LYNHWLRRQNDGLEPFIILNPGPKDQRKMKKATKAKGKEKEKSRWEDVQSDDEDVRTDKESGDEKEEKDGSDEEEDVEMAKLPAKKIGPPKKKRKLNDNPNAVAGPSGIHDRDSTPLAGTSALPPPVKNASKKDPPTENALKKTKKRKADEDIGGPPEKQAKTNRSNSKRKVDEPEESPPEKHAKTDRPKSKRKLDEHEESSDPPKKSKSS
jgi:hypothetical protein